MCARHGGVTIQEVANINKTGCRAPYVAHLIIPWSSWFSLLPLLLLLLVLLLCILCLCGCDKSISAAEVVLAPALLLVFHFVGTSSQPLPPPRRSLTTNKKFTQTSWLFSQSSSRANIIINDKRYTVALAIYLPAIDCVMFIFINFFFVT